MGLLDRFRRNPPALDLPADPGGLAEAQETRVKSEELLAEVLARQPEVSRVASLHRQLRGKNHFGEMLELAMTRRGRS